MKMAALPGFLVAVLLLAGCSEDRATPASASADGKQVVTALTPGLTEATLGVETADAACAAARLVDQVGVQRLVQAGVVTPELAPTTRALADSELATAASEARSSCLEDKVATAIAAAIPTIRNVPAIALPKPPPVSKPVGGNSVNTSRFRRAPPRVISM